MWRDVQSKSAWQIAASINYGRAAPRTFRGSLFIVPIRITNSIDKLARTIARGGVKTVQERTVALAPHSVRNTAVSMHYRSELRLQM
jgi:hypothetical protein